ncbi:unnamed protein product [Rotaria sp. Silwood1]|nr:unnamed protein product [Rotaria sp. Silwood1]CAF1281571.1 unnamed protein product [Rotaria sp. Silwood1]CAF1615219.1 unnamed protein product [Rotaria sp. Silwood1]CAF1622560.1 unnamed protein product [Rotaria sp. Silwood1]CAF3729107.1 unnamed protein product [Rotaria sp. Silwood1]
MLTGSEGASLTQCTKYGDPPVQSSGSRLNYNKMVQVCKKLSGQRLTFTDSNNEARCACLLITSSSKALPLVVWLQPSVVYPTSVYNTNFIVEASTAKLTGKASGPSGYHLLLPAARITKNFECSAVSCIAWDTWYRNFNRSDLKMNVDVRTIDYFINHVVYHMPNVHVDSSRVFLSGWSNGASMALLYALNAPNIAAAATYSSTNPYQNDNDPCPQTPYPSQRTSVLDLVNECDSAGICLGGQKFIADLNNRYGNQLTAKFITITGYYQPKPTPTPKCVTCSEWQGLFYHGRWPVNLNDQIFYAFFRNYTSH